MSKDLPAQVFPPGEFLLDEMRERNWTHEDVVKGTWMSVARLTDIIDGARITFPEAELLGHAFGTSAALWLNLQMAWIKGRG